MSIDNKKYCNGSGICPKCGKPYTYVGDIIEGSPKPYCTCNQDNWKISFSTLNTGWICPVCGRGVNPNLTSCPCTTEPHNIS